MRDLKIFTDNIDEKAVAQIDLLLQQDAFKDSKVRIMPDVHAGKGCVIGFTGDLGDRVIPNIVGVDIGCGMFCANLGKVDIDFEKLDEFIHTHVPSGMSVNEHKIAQFDLSQLKCYDHLKNLNWIENSVGSLGGGNHFIEIDTSDDGEKYLVIHSGSRNLGVQIAAYYQDMACKICNYDIIEYMNRRNEVLETYKLLGRQRDIQPTLDKLKEDFSQNRNKIPDDLAYLEGEYRAAYLHDMNLCQLFAVKNRYTMAQTIADYMGWSIESSFESIHNYISFEDNIVRKGAISARKGEQVIIPINMRDGCILGVGKGNEDWNNSAPHGAGRVMSRMKAMEVVDLGEYKKSMENVYTTSVNEGTKDESPFVYKSIDEILEHIIPTVQVTKVIKPIYNFKASDVPVWKK